MRFKKVKCFNFVFAHENGIGNYALWMKYRAPFTGYELERICQKILEDEGYKNIVIVNYFPLRDKYKE